MYSRHFNQTQRNNFQILKIHAKNTENLLAGTTVDNRVFHSALEVLHDELQPEENLLGPGVNYLKTVAKGLLYKVYPFLQCQDVST